MENNSSLHDYKQKYPFLDIVYIMDGDEKVHYIAKQDVPRNTKITDTRYWQPIDIAGDDPDYANIRNKPTINGVEVDGEMTSEDLGVYSKPDGGIPESDLAPEIQSQLNKHFKGWYDSSSNLPTNPVVGDYAYVKGATSSDPAAIYECTTAGTWTDSERTEDTSSVQTFQTGEAVNSISISEDVKNGGPTDIPTSKSLTKIASKLNNVTLEEVKDNSQDIDGYYIRQGLPYSHSGSKYKVIDVSGYDCVRFLGMVYGASATRYVGYAFYDDTNDGSMTDGTGMISPYATYPKGTADTAQMKEYIVRVPSNAKWLFVTSKTAYISEFYCYLQKGYPAASTFKSGEYLGDVNITQYTEKDSADVITAGGVHVIEQDLKNHIVWQLETMSYKFRIGMSQGKFTSASGNYSTFYCPCSKDELIKLEVSKLYLSDRLCFSENVPTVDNSYTGFTKITETGVIFLKAPIDGYLCVFRHNTSAGIFVYKESFNLQNYFKHKIPCDLTVYKLIDCNESSQTYGEVVNVLTEAAGSTDYIEISDCKYIGLSTFYTKSDYFNPQEGVLYGSMFYDENKEPISFIPITRSNTEKIGYSVLQIPASAKYIRVTIPKSYNFITAYDKVDTATEEYIESVVLDNIKENDETLTSRSIFELNPTKDVFEKLVAANKVKYTSGNENTLQPLVLAHISDAHKGIVQYERFVEFSMYWKNKGYIDEIIDTGDVVYSKYLNGVAWRESIAGTENIITVIGNHDTRSDKYDGDTETPPEGQNIWQYHSNISLDVSKRKDTYIRYLVGPDTENPYYENWGVTLADDAATYGYCYYYKDYANRNLRLIGVDVMGYDATEDAWLQNVLADAITNGYHVVILAHFCGETMVPLTCNYTSLYLSSSTDRSSIDEYNEDIHLMPTRVDAFQTAGGNFVGYIMGHYHRDMVNVLTNYPKQLAFAVSSGGVTTIRDFTKVAGSKSYDDFQIVSINTYDKTVRLIKIGADVDYYMRRKGTLCVGYNLVKDDGTSPEQGETPTKVKGIIGEGV